LKYARFLLEVLLFIVSFNSLYSQVKDTTLIVYFPTDVFETDSSQARQIKDFAAAVAGISRITGYTDSIGTEEYNLNLSKQRARSVAYILKHDLPDKLIDYKGEAFVRSNDLSKNRIVEINGYVTENQIIDIFDVDNIFFVPDKPIITPESLPYVQTLVRRLKTYKNAYFELVGHVNYQSKHSSSFLKDLFKLSEQRANVINDLLVENGIPADHIQHRGVGNTQPIYPDPANDEQRRKNMRVEVIVYK
jgi:outer membrane protein OmpA-like peptidoglycan-associated protein